MLYILLGIVCGAAMAIVLKIFRDPKGNRFGIIIGNYLTCIVLGFLFLPDKGQLFRFSPFPLLGLLGGLFYVGGLVFMQRSVAKNGAAVTAAFSKLGLVVCILVSVAFLGERPNVPQIVGIVLALVSVLVMNVSPKGSAVQKAGKGASVLLLLVLLTGGGGETMAKIFEHVGKADESALYLLILFSTAAVLACVFAVFEYQKTKRPILPKELLSGVALGAPNFLSSYFVLRSLSTLPAVVAYPVYSGGVIVLVTALSFFIFRERPTKRQWIGLSLILVSLVLLNLH